MRTARNNLWIAGALVGLLALSACGGGDQTATDSAGSETEQPTGEDTAGGETTGAQLNPPSGYPSGPIEVIVPFDPGGGASTSQRTFNQYAQPIVGTSMSILNRPGAGGATGWAEAMGAEPDGQTLTIATPPFNILPALVSPDTTGYTLDEFTYLCVYAVTPDLLYVSADSEFQTLEDLVNYATQNPGNVTIGTSGATGADARTMFLFVDAAGIEVTQVPFTGGAQSVQALLGGSITAMVGSPAYLKSHEGQVRALAIGTAEKSEHFPDVPTFTEQGYDVVAERFRSLAGPPGMPQELIDYWGKVCMQVTDNPEFRDAMLKLGQPPAYKGPQESTEAVQQMTEDLRSVAEKYF